MKTTAPDHSLLHFDNLELDTHIRVLMQDDAPLFVAKDVCDNLQIVNSRDALASLDSDEKVMLTSSNVGNTDIRLPNRGLQFVTESGLYALIFKSTKSEAKKFRKWVTSEVLPAIRRNGRYDPAALDGLPPEARSAGLNAQAEHHLSQYNRLRHLADEGLVIPGQLTVFEWLHAQGISLSGAPVARLSQACKVRAYQLGLAAGSTRTATIGSHRRRLCRTARTFPESILAEICGQAA